MTIDQDRTGAAPVPTGPLSKIDYDEKMALLESGSLAEEITRRLRAPRYADRVARVEFERTGKTIHLRVSDKGPGFDFATVLNASIAMDRPNGRGIWIARTMCFEQLSYRGRGNVVEAVMRVPREAGIRTSRRSE